MFQRDTFRALHCGGIIIMDTEEELWELWQDCSDEIKALFDYNFEKFKCEVKKHANARR